MKKLLAFLLLLLFILLAYYSWGWYKNTVVCCDNTTIESEEIVAPEMIENGPLVFNWNSGDITTNDLWPEKKKEILAGLSDGKILQIIGPYFNDEINNTTFDNLGLARADAIKQLLLDSIAPEKMELNSKLIDFYDDAKTNPFEGVEFNWAIRNENIQEIDDKALIYFPYNSAKKIDNANINNYLSGVADALKDNDKTVSLTGHTDNIGNPPFNKKLGLQRATAMKNLLVELGVDTNKINVSSKGQSQPIATNDTEEGRQKNRRVELEIK